MSFGVRRLMTEDDREVILDFFKAGQNITHIVFLLDYEIGSDDINRAIREYILELERKCNT